MCDHEPFLAVNFDRKRGAAPRTQRGMTVLNCPLDVMWIMITTANDDQVFEAPGHKQIAVEQNAEVSGAQNRFTIAGVKRARCLLCVFPVTFRYVWTGNADLAHLTRQALVERFRPADAKRLAERRTAATHQRSPICNFNGHVLLQGCGINRLYL